MTIISQPVTDLTGADDDTMFVFYRDDPLSLSEQGDTILTWTDVTVRPVNGVLTTPDLAPGPAKVKWNGQAYDLVIPDSPDPVELWPLIRDYIPHPPAVVSEVVAMLGKMLTTRDEVDAFVQWLGYEILPQVVAEAQRAIGAADDAGEHSRDASGAKDAADGHRRDAAAAAAATQADRQAVGEFRDEVVAARGATTSARDAALTAVEEIDAVVEHVDKAKTDVVVAASRAEGAAGRAGEKADEAGISASEARAAAEQAAGVVPPASATEFGKLKLRGALAGTAEEPLLADEVIDFGHLSTTAIAPGVGSVAEAVAFALDMLDSYLHNQGWSRETLARAVREELDNKADLDSSGHLVQAQVPSIAISDHLGTVNSQAAMLALVGERGDWCIRNDRGTVWVVTKEPSSALSSWVEWVYPVSPVDSVNGRKGAIELAAVDILDSTPLGRTLMKVANAAAIRAAAGLDRVENTRDMDKPVSTATAQVFADFESAVASQLGAKVAAAGLTAGLWTGTSRPATGTSGIVYLEF